MLALAACAAPPQPAAPKASARELRDELARRQRGGQGALSNSALAAYPTQVLFKELRDIQSLIYGTDDRKEVQLAPERARLNALAVAAVVPASALDPVSNDWRFAASVATFEKRLNVCPEEPFHDQPSAANCTAFLTKPNVVVTAAHCVEDGDLASWRFVFGYQMNGAQAPSAFSAATVYSGKRILGRKLEGNGTDWAVVELDRPVAGIEPLRAPAKQPALGVGTDLYVIGCPAGLPLKYAGNAAVRDFDAGRPYFLANFDTYGGNSGSPVFTGQTHELAGILVRGAQDFAPADSRNCLRSLVCPDAGCRGEDAMRLALVPAGLWQ